MTVDQLDLLISGRHETGATGARLEVLDPATGQPLAEVADAQPVDVQRAIDAARAAQVSWADRAPRERGAILGSLASLIRRNSDRLARLEALDTGKPLAQARADVEVAAQYFEFYGGFADKLYGDTIPLGGDRLGLTLREPLGVTGHIIPWNYPLQIGSRTVAPSLMAGNSCVVKPAEEAPLAALALGDLALEADLPAGVLNLVPGQGEVAGAYLAGSDGIDHLSFTGGLDTGRIVMTAAARNVKPVTLELGGKSPSIVFADADLDRALPVLTKALIQNAGQTCSAGTRVIVQAPVHAELVERLAREFEKVSLGRGVDDPDMGPLISAGQRQRVLEYVQIAREEGAEVVVGGEPADVPGCRGGFFVSPTLLDGVEPTMRVAQEEIFGPVLSVLVFEDEAEALAVANGTAFGLIASVWTRDIDRAMRVARRVEAGQVYLNSYGAAGGVALPFGGSKHSGFGREKGVEAVFGYTQTKTVVVDVAPASSSA